MLTIWPALKWHTSDIGVYLWGHILQVTKFHDISSIDFVNLVIFLYFVVSPPLISSLPVSAIQIISPADLTLSCSAIGHPLPNITWIRTLGNGSQTILSNTSAGNGKEQIILNINDDIMIRSK